MSIDKIAKFDDGIPAAFETVASRRKAWDTVANEVILPALEEAIEAMPNGQKYRYLYAVRRTVPRNLEAVELRFGSIPSGIVYTRENTEELGAESGAVLGFLQGSSGRLQTAVFPFELTDSFTKDRAKGPMLFGPIFKDPTDITREDVLKIVHEFLCWSNTSTQFRVAGHTGTKGFWRSRAEIKAQGIDGADRHKSPSHGKIKYDYGDDKCSYREFLRGALKTEPSEGDEPGDSASDSDDDEE